MKIGTLAVRAHRARRDRDQDDVKVKELLDKLLSNTEVHRTTQSVEVIWGFTPSQWRVVHMLASIQGRTTDAFLEELGRKLINGRTPITGVEVGQGTAVVDTDDIEL